MEKFISKKDLQEMPRLKRLNFFNTLSGIKSAHLIGTIDKNGAHNLGIFNSVVHIGSNPPYLGFIMRPLTVHRQTYHNIKATGFYTLNQVNEAIFRQAHQTSAKYAPGQSEFAATKLTPWFSEQYIVPYVQESHIKIGLKFIEEQHIKANDTRLIIGEVQELFVPEEAVLDSGHVQQELLQTVGVSGLDSYFQTKLLDRLPYARPEQSEK